MGKQRPVTLALLGAGMRGELDLGFHVSNLSDTVAYVAVAEPDESRRNQFVESFGVKRENAFGDWRELLQKPRLADAVLNALPCRMHYESTKAALQAGYHVWLEKPMAHRPAECIDLVRRAGDAQCLLVISLENRFNRINRAIRERLRRKDIGRLMHISCAEDIGYFHFAMSYVRGGHRQATHDNSFIIAKGIHDLDLLTWWTGAPATRVASFGDLTYFKKKNAPDGAPRRCIEGCPAQKTCPFDAVKLYLDPGHQSMPLRLMSGMSTRTFIDYLRNPRFRTLAACIVRDISKAGILKELEEGTHGLCVFQSDNGVADHQTTSIAYDNDVTCSYSLTGFSLVWERNTIFNGTGGEIRSADFSGKLQVRTFQPARVHRQRVPYHGILHGGGDVELLRTFARAVRGEAYDSSLLPLAENALESHLIALAVEEARRQGQVIEMDAFRRAARDEAEGLSSC